MVIQIKRLGLPKRFIKISQPLPHPPGIPNLPNFIFFYIDKRFTKAEVTRIQGIINNVLAQWNLYYTQKFNNHGVTTWGTCVQKYTTQGLTPVWRCCPVHTPIEALDIAMNQFTQMFRDNGFKLSPPSFIFYRIPTPVTASTIFARTATRRKRVPLTVTMNPKQIERADITNGFLAGSLIHAWLHRAGWVDPPNRNFTTYFIGEAPMCVMRGFQDKTPGVPESFYTKYFD